MDIPLHRIDLNPGNFERHFRPSDGQDGELIASLRRHGQLTPILVVPHGDRYLLLAGERRVHAARHLGWGAIRAEVRNDEASEQDLVLLAENAIRRNPPPWALMACIDRIWAGRATTAKRSGHAYTQHHLARDTGLSASRLRWYRSLWASLTPPARAWLHQHPDAADRLLLADLQRVGASLTDVDQLALLATLARRLDERLDDHAAYAANPQGPAAQHPTAAGSPKAALWRYDLRSEHHTCQVTVQPRRRPTGTGPSCRFTIVADTAADGTLAPEQLRAVRQAITASVHDILRSLDQRIPEPPPTEPGATDLALDLASVCAPVTVDTVQDDRLLDDDLDHQDPLPEEDDAVLVSAPVPGSHGLQETRSEASQGTQAEQLDWRKFIL